MLLIHLFNGLTEIAHRVSRFDYFRILPRIILSDQISPLIVVIGIDILRIEHCICEIHNIHSFHATPLFIPVTYSIAHILLTKWSKNSQKISLNLQKLYPKYFCIRLSNRSCVSSNAFCTATFDLSVCSTKLTNAFCSSNGGTIKRRELMELKFNPAFTAL